MKILCYIPHMILLITFLIEKSIIFIKQKTIEDTCNITNGMININIYIFIFVIVLDYVITLINKRNNIEVEPSFKLVDRVLFILELIVLIPLMLVGKACVDVL